MGRKKKEEITHRTHHITLRITDVEYDLIMDMAKEAGMSRSEYLRKIILDAPVEIRYEVVADIEELKKLTAEFGKIGSNLNQIAKYFNMGGVRSKAMQDEIHECVSKLFDLRKEVLKMAGEYNGNFKTHRK